MLNFLFTHIDFLIDLVLAFITMSLGLGLSKHDFKQLFVNPRSLSVGLFAQMVLLPLAAFLLMSVSDFSPETKVGFIIISVCPGGVTSNLVSFLLKGNVALSISLTVVNGVLCMFTIPLLVNLSLNYYIHDNKEIILPVLDTIQHIALVTVIPATIGIIIRNQIPKIADTLQPVLKYLLPILLLIVFLIKIFAPVEKGGLLLIQSEIISQGIWVLLLNFSGMFLGYLAGYLMKVNFQNKITIIIEVGLQNTALALLVAGNILHNNEMQKPGLVYAMFTFASTFIFGWLIKTIASKWIEKKSV